MIVLDVCVNVPDVVLQTHLLYTACRELVLL